jgi:hypothetical protein
MNSAGLSGGSKVTATPEPLIGWLGSPFAGAARDKTPTHFPGTREGILRGGRKPS